MGPVPSKASESKNSLIFFKTINFKVMKTIRNQLKYPIGLQLRMLLCKGIKIKTRLI